VIVLEILGIIGVLLLLVVSVIVLPLLGSLLKSMNKSIVTRGPGFRKQVNESMTEIQDVNKEIEALAAATKGVKVGMDKALSTADRVIEFLESKVFQLGLPAILWAVFFLVALPRAIFHRKKKREAVEPIPPPSWQAAAERMS
jgi:predicted PurR-regulated permease PerM